MAVSLMARRPANPMRPIPLKNAPARSCRTFVDGSDARIIKSDDLTALLRLWREKWSEAEPEDLAGNLIVQLGLATEPLKRRSHSRVRYRHCIGVRANPMYLR